MKALFISLSTYDIVGGIQAYNKKFLRSLDFNNIESKVISLHDCQTKNENIICCKSNIFKFIFYVLIYSRYGDINIWSHINLSPIFICLRVFFRGKNLLITHGVEVWYDDLTKLKKKSLNLYDKILTVSNYTKEKLVSVQGVIETNVGILANSINVSNQYGSQSPLNTKNFNILSVLRVDASDKLKSILNVLDALVLLDDSEIFFTVIGKGDQMDFIKAEIAIRGLEDQVNMLGYVEDLRPYLEHCDLFSLISDREGFGIVYLEAMEYRKPCLSARNCGSSDVVIDGYNGYSIEIDNIKYLADRIIDLKKDEVKRNFLGNNGQELLFSKFTFESFIKKQNYHIKSVCSHVDE